MLRGVPAGHGTRSKDGEHHRILAAGDSFEHGVSAGDQSGDGDVAGGSERTFVGGSAGAWADLAVGRLPGIDLCDGASAGDGYIGESAFAGSADGAACGAAAARADDGPADPGRSAGAGGRGAGQPAEASVGRGECHAVRSGRARIIRNKSLEESFTLYGVTRHSAIYACLRNRTPWNLEEESLCE